MESGPVIAILPCNDVDASERFYNRLGFMRIDRPMPEEPDTYRILSNGKGRLHLTAAVEGWLVPGRDPFGRISIWRTWRPGPLCSEAKFLGRAGRKTSRGACTSLQCLIRTRLWCGSAGRAACANPRRRPRKGSRSLPRSSQEGELQLVPRRTAWSRAGSVEFFSGEWQRVAGRLGCKICGTRHCYGQVVGDFRYDLFQFAKCCR